MSRSLKHPLVRTIVRALDRAEQSERTHPGCGIVRTTASVIIELGASADRFSHVWADGTTYKWPDHRARAAVIAWARVCPPDNLRWMAEQARKEMRSLDHWDRIEFYRFHGHNPPRTEAARMKLDKLIAAEDAALSARLEARAA